MKTNMKAVLVVVSVFISGICFAADYVREAKVLSVEPVTMVTNIVGCMPNGTFSLKNPKWYCDEHGHGRMFTTYRVVYEYDGNQLVVFTANNPGNTIKIKVGVDVATEQENMTDELVLKTSEQWLEDYPRTVIYDPDGWDRTNFKFSFNEELITKAEFEKRKLRSTCFLLAEMANQE